MLLLQWDLLLKILIISDNESSLEHGISLKLHFSPGSVTACLSFRVFQWWLTLRVCPNNPIFTLNLKGYSCSMAPQGLGPMPNTSTTSCSELGCLLFFALKILRPPLESWLLLHTTQRRVKESVEIKKNKNTLTVFPPGSPCIIHRHHSLHLAYIFIFLHISRRTMGSRWLTPRGR